MGAWQIISPKSVVGYVMHVDDLHKVMNDVFDRPTIVRRRQGCWRRRGVPRPAPSAVLTTCSVDVLSHTAVRARATAARSSPPATSRSCSRSSRAWTAAPPPWTSPETPSSGAPPTDASAANGCREAAGAAWIS